MRKIKTIVAALFVLFLMNSCIIVSLNPCFTKNDVVYRHDFEGVWHDSDDVTWNITPRQTDKPGKNYMLEMTDKETTSVFVLHIAKLGEYLFLDFFPDVSDNDPIDNLFLSFHRIPVHSFALIKFVDDKVFLNIMNEDWFKEEIKNWPDLAYQEIEGLQVLTAPTQQIQKFLIENADNKKAFIENEIVLSKTE